MCACAGDGAGGAGLGHVAELGSVHRALERVQVCRCRAGRQRGREVCQQPETFSWGDWRMVSE